MTAHPSSCARSVFACLWQNGKMRDLGTLGGHDSSATAINTRGQIIGNSATTRMDRPGFNGIPIHHGFLWQNGRMRDLGALGSSGYGGSSGY